MARAGHDEAADRRADDPGRTTSSSTITGGLDYFEQQNDILSPPTLQFRARGRPAGHGGARQGVGPAAQPGGERDLQLYAGLGTLLRDDVGGLPVSRTQHLNQTNAVGKTILAGQQNVNQATSIIINQTPDAGARLRDVRAGRAPGTRPAAARHRWVPRGPLQRERGHAQVLLLPEGLGLVPIPDAVLGSGRSEAAWRVRPDGQSAAVRPEVHARRDRDDRRVSSARWPARTPGASDIKPERQTEIEGGFDATLGNEFATLSFTYYNKTITDLLLVARVAPSTGRTNRIFNGGKLRNLGQEVSLSLSPLRRPDLNWILRTTFSRNRSKVVELPVPAFQHRRLRHVARRVPDRAGEVRDADRRQRRRGRQLGTQVPDVPLQRSHVEGAGASASCGIGRRAATSST